MILFISSFQYIHISSALGKTHSGWHCDKDCI